MKILSYLRSWLAGCLLLTHLSGVEAAPVAYTLPQLQSLAQYHNRGILAAQASVEVSREAIGTAAAFPNPEVETLGQRRSVILPGAQGGQGRSVWLTQRLEYPWQRRTRIETAEAALVQASAQALGYEADIHARLKFRFFDLLRREAELKAAHEDQALLEQIRKRVELRVNLGESARYELIKADAEVLNAQKASQSALLRVGQARAALRQQVGDILPVDFQIQGALGRLPSLPDLPVLRDEVLANNPALAQARAAVSRAEHQLAHERSLRWPSLAVKAGYDQDPEIRANGIGLVLTVPVFDQRQGPIGEAEARLNQVRYELDDQRFALQQTLESAYQQFLIALNQVTALQSGILRQAEAALKVAEAGYRYGERGILDYLDAQRVFRSARNELIAARFDLQAAAVEIARLRGEVVPVADERGHAN